MARAKDLAVAMCDFNSLYLPHMLCEAFQTEYLTHGVVHRIQVRRDVLQQHQAIGVVSVCPQILHLRSNFLLRQMEILVLEQVHERVRFIRR